MRVLILGSGIIGTTSAYYLAKQGHDVTVIDRQNSVALETSHANAGQLSYSFSSPWAAPGLPLSLIKWMFSKYPPLVVNPNLNSETVKFLYQMLKNCNSKSYEVNKSRMVRISNFSKKCLLELEKDEDIFYEQRKQGSLLLFKSAKQIENIKKDLSLLEKLNIQYELLDLNGCIQAEPGLHHVKSEFTSGLRFANDCTGNCYLFTNQLYKKCREMGVKFEFNTQIEDIQIEKERISSIKTNRGEFDSDSYVVALGSYSSKILSKIGINIPLYPVKGYSITLPVLNNEDAPQSTIIDDTFKIGITRLGNNIRVAGTAHITGYNLELREKSLSLLKYGLNRLFPYATEECDDMKFWAGLRPNTPDGPPIIGSTPYSNLYLNTGHGTLGWTMSLGSGKLLADIISGIEPEISLEGIDMSRFNYANKTLLNYG
jgi:D-amino-acid dehydrogenase